MSDKKFVFEFDTQFKGVTIAELNGQIAELKKTQSELIVGSKEHKEVTKQLTQAQTELANAKKGVVTEGQATLDTLNLEGKSYNQLVAEMRKVKDAFKDATDPEQREELGKIANAYNDKLKELDASTGNFQRNVGNYASALSGAFGTNLVGGVTKANDAMKMLATNPIGAMIAVVVGLIAKLVDQFKKSEDRTRALDEALASLRPILDGVNKAFDAVADVLGKVVVKAIEKVSDGVEWLAKQIDKVSKFFGGEGGLAESFEKGREQLQELSKATHDYEDHLRAFGQTEAKVQGEISALQEKVNSREKYSVEERMKYTDQIIAKEKQLAEERVALAKEHLAIMEAEANRDANNKETNDQLAEAKAKVIEQESALQQVVTNGVAKREQLRTENIKLQKTLSDYLNSASEGMQKELESEDATYSKMLEKFKGDKEAREQIEDAHQKRLQSIRDKYERERLQKEEDAENERRELEKKNREQRESDVERERSKEVSDLTAHLNELGEWEYENKKQTNERLHELELERIDNAVQSAVDEFSAKLEALGGEEGNLQKQLQLQGLDDATREEINARLSEIGTEKESLARDTNIALEELDRERLKAEEDYNKSSKALARDVASYHMQQATQMMGYVADILGDLADAQDENNREGFEKSKKLRIAEATIQMISGIATAISGAFTTKTGPWDIALAAAQATAIGVASGVNIAKIKKEKYDGGDSSSASTSSVTASTQALSAISQSVQSVSNVTGASAESEVADTRVYVVESDITDAQNRVSVAESGATY